MTFQAFVKRVLVVVFALLALWYLRNTLLLAFAAVVIAVGLSLPARMLQRFGLGRGWANTLAAVGVGVALLVLTLWLVPTVAVGFGDLLAGLPGGVQNLAAAYNDLRAGNESLGRVLPPLQVDGSTSLTETDSLTETEIRSLLERAPSTGLPVLVSGGGAALSVLTNLAPVLFIALLLLADPLAYITASLYLTPKRRHGRLLQLWAELYKTLQTWLSSLFISITVTVSLVWLVLGLLGMPHVAVVAGLRVWRPSCRTSGRFCRSSPSPSLRSPPTPRAFS